MERRAFLAGTLAPLVAPAVVARRGWRAGVAVTDITPLTSLWMAGFAARKEPSRGVAQRLHAKVLALEDPGGTRAVLVALDLLGVTGDMTRRIAAAVSARHGIPRARLLVNASHTHCGPVVDGMLSVAYDLTPAQIADVARYTRTLERQVVDTIDRALGALVPATLHAGQTTAGFAANRRVQFSPDGPVDHRVPLLRVDVAGGPRAILFGYACHNTTLQGDMVRFHGDYAGVAQAAIETRAPGVTAFYLAGCGADANPRPRGTLALVEQHGGTLATAVLDAWRSLSPVDGPLRSAYAVATLPFAPVPGVAEWQRRASEGADVYIRRHASLMLDTISRHGRLPSSQADPVQVWRLGTGPTLVAQGGEVVVDYALRLYREWPQDRIWAAGYSNDVFGYVPSRRVLDEGGYEGGGAMIYYGRPGPFDTSVEDRLMSVLTRLLRSTQ
jgi:hypothetical protein